MHANAALKGMMGITIQVALNEAGREMKNKKTAKQ